MNIEDVRKVFGAVAPLPMVAEKKSNIVPVILTFAIIGVIFWTYENSKNVQDVNVLDNISRKV